MATYSFIVKTKPKSYNSWGSASIAKKERYQELLATGFSEAHTLQEPLCEDLYGIVYHFFKRDIGLDADNLSKPVWDCLRSVLFDDDKRVKLRIAGSFDLTNDDLSFISSSGLSGKLIAELLVALETEDHLLYIECGTFSADLIRLNLNRDAN